jgi:hypothetical protein
VGSAGHTDGSLPGGDPVKRTPGPWSASTAASHKALATAAATVAQVKV